MATAMTVSFWLPDGTQVESVIEYPNTVSGAALATIDVYYYVRAGGLCLVTTGNTVVLVRTVPYDYVDFVLGGLQNAG